MAHHYYTEAVDTPDGIVPESLTVSHTGNRPMNRIRATNTSNRRSAAILVLTVLSTLIVANQCPADSSQYQVKSTYDIRYAEVEGEQRKHAGLCDVFVPQIGRSDCQKSWPVVLVVHGGAWMTGGKWSMYRHSTDLAKSGIAAVSVNYRLAPQSKFPDQVDDLRSALVWIHDHAKEHHFDLNRVGLYGYSAGGHLVSLVGTLADEPWQRVQTTTNWKRRDPRWKRLPSIRAVCVGGPPTDFRNMPPDSRALAYFLGGSPSEVPETYTAASPICFASSDDPSFKIIHGQEDNLVSISNSTDFNKALRDASVDVSFETLPGKGHMLTFFSPKLTQWMTTFFVQELQTDRN